MNVHRIGAHPGEDGLELVLRQAWKDRGGKGMLGNVSGQGRWDRALLKTHEDGK